MRSVVVTGLGFITCLGNARDEVETSLRTLRHGIEVFPSFAPDHIPVKVAAPIREFATTDPDPEDWTYPERYRIRLDALRTMAPHVLYAHCALTDALADAGLERDAVSDPRTGLFAASGGSGVRIYNHLKRLYEQGPARCSPMSIVSSVAGTLNFNLVTQFKIQGSSAGFVSACASSGHALGYAFDEIALGRQDRMLVVGAEDCNDENILAFSAMRALSPDTDPDRASRPFDKTRNGFVGTGGAVAMILEDAATARARGATPYAAMRGWGQASDGFHIAISHPQGRGLAQAMRHALASADATPGDVDYVNAHATSTPTGDLSEIRALKAVFGAHGEGPRISSTKALTGHGLSLSSIMEAAFCTLMIHRGFIAGSAHIEELEPEAEGLDILRETVDAPPRLVLSNSSGFGGANVALVLAAEN